MPVFVLFRRFVEILTSTYTRNGLNFFFTWTCYQMLAAGVYEQVYKGRDSRSLRVGHLTVQIITGKRVILTNWGVFFACLSLTKFLPRGYLMVPYWALVLP